MTNLCRLVIKSDNPATVEHRIYNSYELAREYIKTQADIHDILLDGSDILFTKNNIIWICHPGVSTPRKKIPEKTSKCMIL